MKWYTDLLPTAIARGRCEILADVLAGQVPADVPTFSALHDYVDANEYGGLCDETADVARDCDPSSDEWCEWANAVQQDLSTWIETGGLAAAVRAAR